MRSSLLLLNAQEKLALGVGGERGRDDSIRGGLRGPKNDQGVEVAAGVVVLRQALAGCIFEHAGLCLLHPETVVSAAYGKILEVGFARELFDLHGRRELLLSVALWKGGLPLDVLPAEGMMSVALGEEYFAWPPG